jgi:hypothetical protein
MHSELPLFDLFQAEIAADRGIAQAAVNKSTSLEAAKAIAVELGQRQTFVTADDVIRVYSRRFPLEPLGNAAGGIFRDKRHWRFAERYEQCERVTSHGRMLRVWEFIGK